MTNEQRIAALRNPAAGRRATTPGINRIEREARTKRALLVGVLASFVAIFGLAVAADQGGMTGSTTAETANAPIVYYDNGDGTLTTAPAPQPQIVTRSS